MMIGIGIGITAGGRSVSLFNRVYQELFGSGEQGIYMPSVHESFLRGDLYQDAAGTTPVTAAGQPVGLLLDRSGNDNHASQATSAARPALQTRVNMITKSENFNDSAWILSSPSVATAVALSPAGTMSANKLIPANGADPAAANSSGVYQFGSIPQGTYTISVYAKTAEHSKLRFREGVSTGAFLTFDLSDSSITNGSAAVFVSPTIEDVGGGWFRCDFTTASNTTILHRYVLRSGEVGDDSSGILIWGYQFEPGADRTTYQRVTSTNDYADVGAKRRLWLDNVDDKLTVTFPSSLGSACTVGRAMPGVGASILTGQTVGDSYDLIATTCGIVIVNRALTAGETNRLTQLLDKAAGV